jgi:membrane protein YdbS with pleckstrin-like domain/predicted Ser/Thr protein kinase
MPAFDFVLSGRYRLLAPLGEGGMASVYRARDLRLNREVAVKILRDELTRDPDFLARFEREAQTVASLSHPNIVPVYDVGTEDSTHFIVMEFVRGRTLKDLLESGPFPDIRAANVMQQILDALQYAHERGLIHRDVKPQNILITSDGIARLADFGIAHLVDGSSTRTAAILGSAQYLSPEQARGEQAGVQSDIYACGVVLYEMLAGQPPFAGRNALQIAHHHVHTAPNPLPGSVNTNLQHVTMRALAKEPNGRFSNASEFCHALKQVIPNLDLTVALPLAGFETEHLEPMSHLEASAVAEQGVDENRAGPGLVLRRSSRRTAALALLFAASLAAAAYLAYVSPGGVKLPSYPSAPYALVIVLLGLIVAATWLGDRSWSYRMDGNAAVVQWGLLGHHRFGVPVRYISTVELKQSPIDRLLGVGTVELCARDSLGEERRLTMQDLAHPRETYEELMRMLGRAGRAPVPGPSDEQEVT